MMISKSGNCTACFACMGGCPTSCITAEKDEYGSWYPKIDYKECINCGRCERICPENYTIDRYDSFKTYVAVNKLNREEKSYASASGGVAYNLYLNAIEHGWVCVGTRWNLETMDLYIRSTNDESDVEYFRNSKYCASNMKLIYSEIQDWINKGKKILVVALPCEIAGLRSAFKEYTDSFIFVDLVCHGVPSGEYFKDYIEKKFSKEHDLKNITFRTEDGYFLGLHNNNGTKNETAYNEDMYFRAYLEGTVFREDCYHCRYASRQRTGDITLGDFDGLDYCSINNKNISNCKYPSMILVNTEKGNGFLKSCKGLIYERRTLEEAYKANAQLTSPSPKSSERAHFMNAYKLSGSFVEAYQPIFMRQRKKEKIYGTKFYRMLGKIKNKIIGG